jgi:hypothetical protein
MEFNINREAIFDKVEALPPKIAVIECVWDGDSNGWFVDVLALEETSSDSYKKHLLATIAHGLGELYDFNRALIGVTPPYPEGLIAQEIGQEIADRLGVPLYFPSPNKPVGDEVPRWVDWRIGRNSSIPVRLINAQSVIDQFANRNVAVVEGYWSYYHKFFPKMSVVTIENGGTNLLQYKDNPIGELYWDDEDIGQVIRGQQIPPRTPTEEAIRLGNDLAEKLNAPFYFASSDKPTHNIPRWITLQRD